MAEVSGAHADGHFRPQRGHNLHDLRSCGELRKPQSSKVCILADDNFNCCGRGLYSDIRLYIYHARADVCGGISRNNKHNVCLPLLRADGDGGVYARQPSFSARQKAGKHSVFHIIQPRCDDSAVLHKHSAFGLRVRRFGNAHICHSAPSRGRD